MQIIKNVYIFYTVRTKNHNLSVKMKKWNLNKNFKGFKSNERLYKHDWRAIRQQRDGVTEHINEFTRSHITLKIDLLIQWNERVNLLIQRSKPKLS